MQTENTTTTTAPQLNAPAVLTADEFQALKGTLRKSLIEIPNRRCPDTVNVNDFESWATWWTSAAEPLADLIERYAALPTPQHLSAAALIGIIGASLDVSRLMAMWADFYEEHPEHLKGAGLSRVKMILEQRKGDARSLPIGLPPIEVCRTLWELDPSSPTGLKSVRTQKALNGETRTSGQVIVYRPATGGKFAFDPVDIVYALEADEDGSTLVPDDRAALTRNEILKEERESMKIITDAELAAINEEFPPKARLALIDMRIRYSHGGCKFRTWDRAARRVILDVPGVLADMRNYIGPKIIARFTNLTEQGIDLAGILCASLRIPLTKGSMMFQDTDTAKGRSERTEGA